MKLISNQKNETHLTEISRLLEKAEEVIFCIAFLKNSGLNSIVEQLKNIPTKCKLFIGTDFYLTEPSALRRLYKDGHTLYLTKKDKTTYHPKIFYFKNSNSIDILVGSTNITGGGFESNIEASFAINTTFNSEIDKEFYVFLNSLIEYSTLVSSDEIISSYEIRYSAYRRRHSNADEQFQIDLQKITEEELKEAEEKEKLKITSGHSSNNRQFVFNQKDYDEFEIFLPRYIEYKTNERTSGVVNKDTGPKDLLKWYQGIKEFIKHEALPEDITKRLIDVDFPIGNGWDATIRMIWNKRYEKLLEYKDKEQKKLNYTYVPQTKKTDNPYYKLGTWIAQQKQRRKGNLTPDWDWGYEEKKMKAINYLWDRPELGGELDDEGWWVDLMKLQEYYIDKRNYHSVPSQSTRLGKWLNDQMTLKRTGSRQKKEKKFLNKSREELLGELLKKNNVEWNWQVQLEREGILEGLKGWQELIEWEKQIGNRKPTDAEINYFKGIRNWKNTTRNRSKKWDRDKEKWKIDLLTKAGFPLPDSADLQSVPTKLNKQNKK
jgi:HKD family nuclease